MVWLRKKWSVLRIWKGNIISSLRKVVDLTNEITYVKGIAKKTTFKGANNSSGIKIRACTTF